MNETPMTDPEVEPIELIESDRSDQSDSSEEPEAPEENPVETETDIMTPEVRRLIAEAEQRGYLRGLNERAEEMMRRPALLENTRLNRKDEDAGAEMTSTFLRGLRPGVWD